MGATFLEAFLRKRLASSAFACGETLRRRLNKLTGALPREDVDHVAEDRDRSAESAAELELPSGKSEIEVCWDFKVVCKNGTEIAPPRSCTRVKDGGTVHYTIPPEKIQNAEKCDADPKPTLSNMTINGEPST